MNIKNKNLYIQADNVHTGGGRLLLNALIQCKLAEHAFFLLDARMSLDFIGFGRALKIVKPTLLSRLKAQFWLWKNLLINDTILCFGNLPPLFNVKGRVVVFVQNRYIIDNLPLKNLLFKDRMRLFVERLWFNGRCQRVNEFIVQTYSMQILLKKRLLNLSPQLVDKIEVKVLPFLGKISTSDFTLESAKNKPLKEFDFIYPASGEAHKNHHNLIDAFIILAKEGYFPSLVLTLDENRFPYVLKDIEYAKVKFNLNILNKGFLPHQKLLELYSCCRCLIYPSLFESFGIPLLEAEQAGLFIVAAELDYVRDSINPDQSFDPNSSVSIARAIKRSLKVSNEFNATLGPDEFLSKITLSV